MAADRTSARSSHASTDRLSSSSRPRWMQGHGNFFGLSIVDPGRSLTDTASNCTFASGWIRPASSLACKVTVTLTRRNGPWTVDGTASMTRLVRMFTQTNMPTRKTRSLSCRSTNERRSFNRGSLVYSVIRRMCLAYLSLLPSNFAQQWSTLRLGMRLSDVHAAIATPPTKSYETDGDGRIEYWLFATTDFSEVPPAEAYVASFNKEMILTEFS